MKDFLNFLYAYCTDFIINLANLSGLSYYEINAFFFCFLFPFLTVILGILLLIQKRRLRKLKL